uniref:Defensin-like protein 2 n=2 Tax=Vigna unguiculata TaxID=3917 RepID=DEF2_VIGUN|nr:RecName: Full=Defensin-like protein 2; AltName: Full=Cp-thionin II; AltName: Full=Cp-thionin-2; AltName: Full=Gamma-thionin II [Vigna unguiculata]
KTCMTKKEGWGRCLIDTTCAHSCRKYGYMGGKCQGITRRCYCLLNC